MMFLSIRHKPHFKEAREYKLFDKDTGDEIPHVIWANDETGRYRQYLADENGKLIFNRAKGEIVSKIFNGNIELRKCVINE